MQVVYKENHLSIKEFVPIEIADFTILTGINGSGKTHLLDAIRKGKVKIDDYGSAQIVYYNYNDFTITGTVQNVPIINSRSRGWVQETESFLMQFNESKMKLQGEFRNKLDGADKLLFQYTQNKNFNINSLWINKDYEALLELQEDDDFKKNWINYKNRFTPSFFMLVSIFLSSGGTYKDLQPEVLKERLRRILEDFEFFFKNQNENLYTFLKQTLTKDIFSLNKDDFESPDFFLEDIANEEKEYRFLRTDNSLKQIRYKEFGEKVEYYSKEEFIKIYGLSPIEQINEVLNEYDCNGYKLATKNFDLPLGKDKDQIKVDIKLFHEKDNYETSFDQLSSGEKTLIALSLLIYKSRKNKIIPRVLLLDEIDSSLHPSMIKRLLKVIEEIFIQRHRLKVILATHSPTTVALSPDESIFVVNKTGKDKIVKQEKSVTIDLLTEGFAALNIEDSRLEIYYNISKTDLPILFTEGITDKILIETAWKKLYNDGMPFYIQDCFDASFLANLFRRGFDSPDGIFKNYGDRIIIGLFDFDYAGYNAWNSLNKLFTKVIENDPNNCLTRGAEQTNAYIMLLPVPSESSIKQQVLKDNGQTFKNESCLQIELLLYGVEQLNYFFVETPIKGGGRIIEFKGEKREFANSLANLYADDFKNFKPLFEKLNQIIVQK